MMFKENGHQKVGVLWKVKKDKGEHEVADETVQPKDDHQRLGVFPHEECHLLFGDNWICGFQQPIHLLKVDKDRLGGGDQHRAEDGVHVAVGDHHQVVQQGGKVDQQKAEKSRKCAEVEWGAKVEQEYKAPAGQVVNGHQKN